ncbi:MAG: lipid-A-disaccharide synthase [Planctomycetaceae bacterium]|nr:lipid-A-disaccharide synthase [Planctomycetaceae bacterium]
MPRIFVSTAEVSAERHASHLVRAFLEENPGSEVNAAGGDLLAGAGASLAVNMTGQAVMGFWEALGHLSFYKRAAESILACLARERHDALVVVDAPSFHLHLARKVHKRWPDLPILYYIAPKLWAWKEWRVKNLRRDITRTMCIFPFEEKFFHDRGVDAVFVGNPTLDQLRRIDGGGMTRVLKVEDVRRHSDPGRGVMAVFPGSRTQEIRYLWPVMVETMALVRARFPELKIAVALAPGWSKDKLAEYAPLPEAVSFIHGESQELLAAASVVLAKSGTTTLEAALLGVPMAVCYAGHAASFYIAKMFVKLPYVSLPNILAGKRLVQEFLQKDATAENLAGEIIRLLGDHRYYRKMRSKLRDLRRSLGDEFAAVRAAREVAAFACRNGGAQEMMPHSKQG